MDTMERRAAVMASDLLVAALEDLSQEQLKRFRLKLQDEPLDGRSIPRGRLERADALELSQQLVQFYGPEVALDVALKTLKRADVRDVAAQLKEQRRQRLGSSTLALLSVSEYKKKYREHVLREHAKVKERNARSVKISKRFTKVLIARDRAEAWDEPPGAADEPEQERARRSDTHTFNRLFRRDHEGQRPLTVLLQGPAGIGKTMAAKKILYDWAAGKLYHGKVDFAFFLACRELLERPGACSLADLLLEQCPDRAAPLREMLQQPGKLLFILDGLDEAPAPQPGARGDPSQPAPARGDPSQPAPARGDPSQPAPACSDPFQPAPAAGVLGGLLSKALLPDARLLVTSRTAVAARMQGRLHSPQCAEVRGFSNRDKKKYFYKFFEDEAKAERAYRFVKANETLFSLCFVPFMCWIVCTVLRRQMEARQDLSRTSRTTTSVYLLYTVGVLAARDRGPQLQREMRRLCRLAREGVLGCRAQFSAEDLARLELGGSAAQEAFLTGKELPGVLEADVIYQFMDHSFQEFFAALSFLLEEEEAAAARGLGALLRRYPEEHGHLALTARFLFGLLSAERAREVERHLGCVVAPRLKQDVLRWVQDQGQRAQRAAPEEAAAPRRQESTGEPPRLDEEEEEEEEREEEEVEEEEGDEEEEDAELSYLLELLYCLYETQEPTFVRQALQGFGQLALEHLNLSGMDIAVLSYCVRCCPAGQALRLTDCRLAVAPEKKKKSLMRRLQGSLGGTSTARRRKAPVSLLGPLCEAITDQQCGLSSLTLSHCRLPDSVCRDLAMAVRRAPALRELALLHNGLSEVGMHALSEGLAWPQCQVQVFRVQQTSVLGTLQRLVSVLPRTPALTTLDLSGCQLSEPVVTYLCGVLRHPECRLQTLDLTSVKLQEGSLQELRTVCTAKPDLVITHPSLNSPPNTPEGQISVL